MVQRTGVGPDISRSTRHATLVENEEESSEESRFSVVCAMWFSAKRSRRDSRNIAIALALLALAVIMFLVTIVKFEEQLQGNGMSQTRGETKPPHVLASGVASLSRRDAFAWGPETNVNLFNDSNGSEEDFDCGDDHVDHRDVGTSIAVALGLDSGRPEKSVAAVYAEIAGL